MDAIDGDPRNRLRVFASGWEIQQLRATAFTLTAATDTEAAGWWIKATDSQPEETQSRPREGVLQQSGRFKEKHLTLNSQQDRVDWRLEDPFHPMPDIKDETVESFFSLVLNWLQECPPISRLALGAILANPVSNRQEGYEKIAPMIPAIQIDPKNSSDLVYQINRPRQSKASPNITINRLCKWAVMYYGVIQVNLIPGNPTSRVVPDQSLHACHLEIDINTSPENKERIDHLTELFQEMIIWGDEISEEGDVP